MKTPGPKDDVNLPETVRALGRTRIEIVPRDSKSVFVYWEVANPDGDDTDPTPPDFTIDIRRESDDESGASFETQSRLDGRIVEVPAGQRYYATLSMTTDEGRRQIARSSTLAGPNAAAEGDASFVKIQAGDDGLHTSPTGGPGGRPVRWNWRGADSSNR